MSRILKVMIVLLTIAAIATPVVSFAEDRLSLAGQLRIRGWVKDNVKDFNDDAGTTDEYFDQRLRIAGTLNVAEGVAVKFQTDLWDSVWGRTAAGAGGTLADGDNKAYMVIDKDAFTFSAGDQSHALGNAIAIDTIGTGAILDFKAIPLQLAYFKFNEDDAGDDDDVDLYTVALSNSTDMYSGTVFGGFLRDGGDTNADAYDVYLLGAQATFNLDAVKLNAELNYFDGEDDFTGGDDYTGFQAYLDASMALSETLSVGGILTYAQGDDEDVQVTEFSDDGSFLPETYGFMQIMYSIYPGSTFDPSGNGLGVMGAQVYGSLKLTDDFSVRASAMYAEVEEDYASGYAGADAWEDFTTFVGSFRYAVAANTNLDGVLSYTSVGAANNATPDDDQMVAGFRLAVNF